MKSSFVALALFVAAAVAQSFTINTPLNVVECEPTLLSWTGGSPPYFLSIQPGNQPGATALENLGQQNGNSFTWTADFAAGTSVGLLIRDTTGATANSAAFSINAGDSTSCIGAGANSPGASSSTTSGNPVSSSGATSAATTPPTSVGTTSAAPVTTTTPPATSAAGTTSSSSKPGTSSSSSSSPSPSTKTSGAKANAVSFGLAGAIGAAVVAILA